MRRTIHRHKHGVLALMNSAPAELLHPLVHAALQPCRLVSHTGLQPWRSPGCRDERPKKTPATRPASVTRWNRPNKSMKERVTGPGNATPGLHDGRTFSGLLRFINLSVAFLDLAACGSLPRCRGRFPHCLYFEQPGKSACNRICRSPVIPSSAHRRSGIR